MVTDPEVDQGRRSIITRSLSALAAMKLMGGCGDGQGSESSLLGASANASEVPSTVTQPAPSPLPTPPTALPPPDVVPSWVPSTGNTWAAVTATNSLESLIPAYYLSAYPGRAFHEFSSSALNPYWGRYGSVVGHGGGHSSSNYDGTWMMDLSYSGITFKRLVAPTHYFTNPNDQGTWTTENKYRNFGSSAYLSPQAQITSDWIEPIQWDGSTRTGHPASVHSYQSLTVIGPAHGGAAHGSLVLPGKSFAGFAGVWGGVSVHRMDLPTSTGANDSYSWARWSGSSPAAWGDSAFNSALVTKQNRIYLGNIKSPVGAYWFDISTGLYGKTPGGTPWRRSVGGSGAQLLYIEERDLLVFVVSQPESGQLLIVDYMRVRTTDTNPNWAQAALSSPISFPTPVGTGQTAVATWCSDNQRIICGNVLDDPNCVYEIAIPNTLTGPWLVERVAFTPPPGFSWPGTNWHLGWHYNAKIRACMLISSPTAGAQETVFVYRPRSV